MTVAQSKRRPAQTAPAKPARAPARVQASQQTDTKGAAAQTSGKPVVGTIPKPQLAEPSRGLELLMAMEGRVRETRSEMELAHFAVNETRKLTGARQIFLLTRSHRTTFKAKAISSMALTDPESPMLRWIGGIVENIDSDGRIEATTAFQLPKYANPDADETKTYPFKNFIWQPLRLPNGEVFAGLLQAREGKWQETAITVSQRLASVYAHTWAAHVGPKKLSYSHQKRHWLWSAAAVLSFLLLFIPVPMTVLAPMEVVARNPFVVASPIDGTIKEIVVDPNSVVEAGDVLFRFDDTVVRNRAQIAKHELDVAQAAYQKAIQGAFNDPEARHQLAIAKAEVSLKSAEYKYATELLSKVTVRATRDGIVISGDKNQWKGRPVATGEKILRIADPKQVALDIKVPVADSIVLREAADVRVFLDASPLEVLDAKVTRASYQGKPTQTNQLAYDVRAQLGAGSVTPRIGARGTAQIYGDKVSLGFFLFRRPITVVRQYLGL